MFCFYYKSFTATLHLYYARFITQFLHHIGLSPVTEPFQKLIPIGMVLGEAYIIKGSGKYLAKAECVQGMKNLLPNILYFQGSLQLPFYFVLKTGRSTRPIKLVKLYSLNGKKCPNQSTMELILTIF